MDKFTKEKRSEIMSRIRGKNTKPEKKARKMLRMLGLKNYRLHYGQFAIDVAFPRQKVAIFIDGCFWHKCPIHYKKPKSNRSYWIPKIERNAKHDRSVTRELKKRGWKVIRIWEHNLK